MAVVHLPRVLAPLAPSPQLPGEEHRSRALQSRFEAGDPAVADDLRSEYDEQAAGWLAWTAGQPDYLLPLGDALERGVTVDPAVVVEVGAGAGPATGVLRERFGLVVAVDLSQRMLLQSAAGAVRLQADARRLPLRSGSVDLLVGVNAVGDWAEIERVLSPRGELVWVSSFGPETPLWTPVATLAAAFPRRRLVTSSAGRGEWSVLLPQDAGA